MILVKETQLRNQILDWLAYNGHFAWLTNTTGNFNKRTCSFYKNPRLRRGVADILGVFKNGKLFAIECKVGKNKQSFYQADFGLQILQNNAVYLLVYSFDDFLTSFNDYLNRNKV
jgi:hypothetical protein